MLGSAPPSGEVLAQNVSLEGHVQHPGNHQGQNRVGQHVGSVVHQGVDAGAGEGHAQQLRGGDDPIDGDAADVVDREPAGAAHHGPREDAPAPPLEEARQPQGREGQQVVQEHGLPAPGVGPVEDQLEQAEGEARQQPRLHPPPHREQQQREHGRGQAPAIGQLHQLDVAEDLGQGHQDGRLAQAAQVHGCFRVGHGTFLLVLAGSACGQKSRMSARRGHTTIALYNRIPTPALPGSGSRDRTALRLISAGVRQRPLDCP